MVSLAKVKAGGRTYWRIVESRRVNGKPRPVPILNLGTADALLERLLKAPEGHLRIQSFQHGDVAALKAAAVRSTTGPTRRCTYTPSCASSPCS